MMVNDFERMPLKLERDAQKESKIASSGEKFRKDEQDCFLGIMIALLSRIVASSVPREDEK